MTDEQLKQQLEADYIAMCEALDELNRQLEEAQTIASGDFEYDYTDDDVVDATMRMYEMR